MLRKRFNAHWLRQRPPHEQKAFYEKHKTKEDRDALEASWYWWSRDEQWPPDGNWRIWLLMGGRGSGKTRAGSEWIAQGVREGAMRSIALLGATYHDARAVMIEGESGILSVDPTARFRHSDLRHPRCARPLRSASWRGGEMMRKALALIAALALSACAFNPTATQDVRRAIGDSAVVLASAQAWWIETCITPTAKPAFCTDDKAKVSAASNAATLALKSAYDAASTGADAATIAPLVADAVADVAAYSTLIATFKGKAK